MLSVPCATCGPRSTERRTSAAPPLTAVSMRFSMPLLWMTLDVVLYYENRQLREVFYDPMFAKSKIAG